MFSHQTSKEYYDKVYQLAQSQDKEGLKKLVAEGACIGITYGEYNPVIQLAEEGDIKAVDLLVNEFGASINWAVEGASRGAYWEWVESLLNRGASLRWAVQGAARRGHFADFVDKKISQGANRQWAVRGAACGGYEDFVCANKRDYYQTFIAHGAALGGQEELLEKIFALNPGYFVTEAVFGLARGGHLKLLERVLQQEPGLQTLAILGLAKGGWYHHCLKLIELIKRSFPMAYDEAMKQAMRGGLSGGHADFFKYLFSEYDAVPNDALAFAIKGHQMELIHYLYAEYQECRRFTEQCVKFSAEEDHLDLVNYQWCFFPDNPVQKRELISNIKPILENHFNEDFRLERTPFKLSYVAFIDDNELRQMLIYNCIQSSTRHMAEQIKQQNQLIRRHHFSYSEAAGAISKNALTLYIWLMQGYAAAKRDEGCFNLDIFLHIASFLTETIPRDQMELFAKKYIVAQATNLYAHSTVLANTELNPTPSTTTLGFFKKAEPTSVVKHAKAVEDARARYEERVKWFQ